MRRLALLSVLALLPGALLAQAPAPTPGPAAEVLRSYTSLKGNILKAAEKMPDDAYQFKATPDVRTYARVVNHITEAQFATCGTLNGLKEIPKPPSDTADKATVIAGLKASYEECDKAYGAVTNANLTDMFTFRTAQRSRIGALWGNISHDNEQYAILSLYLRVKGLVPPTSEK